MHSMDCMKQAGWAHKEVAGPQAEAHNGIGKVVPVNDEQGAVPSGSQPAAGQRR